MADIIREAGMESGKLKILYIVGVFLYLGFFSIGTYNLDAPAFFVPALIVSLMVGGIGFYLFGNEKKLYKNLYFFSYILTVGFAFIPGIGVYTEGGVRYYGFPAQWFGYYYQSGHVSFELLGFLINLFIFYFLLKFLKKIYLRFTRNKVNGTDI
ncbi:hypothetical protein MM300_21195 [Evansella sp. LMS18]|uniref:hypothetical protein n=1 Tax=Evansella sp. LMS18 TaxID=2924033 RepID=UPI0020D06B63|nr:hypothetical protein [Evansella sp. LMS18]UTR10355.1 hypothetical protein MM300_21195 [Evansella sp. LMS18]